MQATRSSFTSINPFTSYLFLPLRPRLTKGIFKPTREQEKKIKVLEKTKLEIALLPISLEARPKLNLKPT